MSVVVTGATGTIGRDVVRLLAETGHEVRALGRSEAKLAEIDGPNVAPVAADNLDTAAVSDAAKRADVMVMITAAAPDAAAQAFSLLSAAKQAGVRKVVRVSAIKAAPDGPTDNTRQHAQTEADICASGLEYVFLRPSYFMQNMFMAAETIAGDGSFSFAMGEGSIGMIDTRDIAACAMHCTLSDQWNGQTLELTGPESISFDEIARRLATALKKPVSYNPITPQAAYEFIDGSGWGAWMAALTRDYGAAYASGWGDFVTEHVAQITGRAPSSFERFAADMFQPSVGSA
ncbi:NAD(P)H-binding protein [Parasphingorhabdus sp.]|uniref:NAD(P)H-binding protein n=1 Tax=Parasphingorhabdus sp. TaxID=2709688 RepID=UPI003A8EFEED